MWKQDSNTFNHIGLQSSKGKAGPQHEAKSSKRAAEKDMQKKAESSSKKKKKKKEMSRSQASNKDKRQDKEERPQKKKKRVSFRDPLERTDSDDSPTSRGKAHQVRAGPLYDISNMLLNPICEVEISDQPTCHLRGGIASSGVCDTCIYSSFSYTYHVVYRMSW